MNGIVSKIESLSTVDGPGLRAVVFLQGCPLRCGYCHNPETQSTSFYEDISPAQLAEKLLRFKPYLAGGGVTFSGGEPLLHAEYLAKTINALAFSGYDFAVETSGGVWNESVQALLAMLDLVILDLKAVTDESYRSLTGSLTLAEVLQFLHRVTALKKRVWIRHVIVPGYNDSIENVQKLGDLMRSFHPERIELLPFRKLCAEKYSRLGREFSFSRYEEAEASRMIELEKYLDREDSV